MIESKQRKALETGSGIAWDDWVDFLRPHTGLNHTDMAKVVYEKIRVAGKSKSPEWWAQGVTVAYEQFIGRRQVGQTCDGNFSVTVSKTLPGNMDEALRAWQERVAGLDNFNGVTCTNPRISQSEKWRYWRCTMSDGALVSVNIQTKPSREKSMLAINHDKLRSSEAVEYWRAYWKEFSL